MFILIELQEEFKKELQSNSAFQVALFILLLTQKYFQTQETDVKTSRYYISNFIRVNLSLLMNVSSTRFGGLMMKFSLFISKYSSIIFQQSEDVLLFIRNLLHQPMSHSDDSQFLENVLQLSEILTFDNQTKPNIYYIAYETICLISERRKSNRNTIANYSPAFSQEKKNVIDWSVSMPKATFYQYTIFDSLVKSGHGLWVPVLTERLDSVGFILF